MNPGKPQHPSIEQIKQVCQPPAVRDRKNSEHWVADVYLRDISPYLTSLLLRTPITANGVTYLMIATGALAGVALLIPGMPGASLALLLGQMQMLWDCSDGEIARWRGTSSPKGVFLDRVGHYVAESFIPVALGLRAAGFPDSGWLESAWPLIGALLALIIMFNKALNDMAPQDCDGCAHLRALCPFTAHITRLNSRSWRLSQQSVICSPQTCK